MPDNPRIEDLRRRVQRDPASIAFAQLAEECRRAELYQDAVDACRAGLALHPGYLSARVTLGRALIELDQLDEAQTELDLVLASAPENLAAIRGLAEIYHRRGALADALKQYRAALALARNDPDLERTVTELARAIEPKPPAPVTDGLSFEQMASELMKNSPPPPPLPQPPIVDPSPLTELSASAEHSEPSPTPPAWAVQAPDPAAAPLPAPPASAGQEAESEVVESEVHPTPSQEDAVRTRALATIAALDQWLAAIHVSRAQRLA